MLLRPVFTSFANPCVLETSRVPSDTSQSRNFISYRAERGWHGLWDVFFCYYVCPSDCENRMRAGEKIIPFGGAVSLKHPLIGVREYQGVQVSRVAARLPLSSALQVIKTKEQRFLDGADDVAVTRDTMHHDHFGLALPHITPVILETTRVIADEGSADFVSYRAIRQWNKRWGLYFCDYLPADNFDKRMEQERKHQVRAIRHIWDGVVRIAHEQAGDSKYRLVTTKCVRGDMELDEALQTLASQEKSFERSWTRGYLERSHALPHTDHYLRFLMK